MYPSAVADSPVWGSLPSTKNICPAGVVCSEPPIRVLLNALLDQSDDEVFMRVTREAMLDVMRMHDFHRIRRAKTMKANPLCRLRHNEKAPRSIAQVSSIFSQNNVA